MANSCPLDTYAIRVRQGQWLVVRPKDDTQDNPRRERSEDNNRKVRVMWLRKG